MTQTLTQLVTRVQAQLIDDGTRFSTATVTAAVRSALAKMNKRIPIHAADILDAVDDQYVYEAVGALYVTDVLARIAGSEKYPPLEYRAFEEDNRAYFRLATPETTGEFILCRYTQAHTVSGLDSATDSTLTADQDQVLVDGACMDSLAYRAASRIETINLQQAVSDNYRASMNSFGMAFEMGIRFYERRQVAPSVDRVTSWNDEWHGFPA